MDKEDKVGVPIWPMSLNRVLGLRFFSATQLAQGSNLNTDDAKNVIDSLLEMGVIQPWLAPKCPKCSYIWAEYLGEDDYKPKTTCPVCNHTSKTDEMTFYHVYEMLEPPED